MLLPGGAGSLDEIFEALTWRQLGLHAKPILVLNTEGFWTPLLELVDHVVEEGFAAPSLRGFLMSADTPDAAMAQLREALG